MRISVFGLTDKGRRRPNNEDDLAVVDLAEGREFPERRAQNIEVGKKRVWLAVADGVYPQIGNSRLTPVASLPKKEDPSRGPVESTALSRRRLKRDYARA